MKAPLTGELLERYREYVYEEYGIHYAPHKLDTLGLKLQKIADSGVYQLDDLYQDLCMGDPVARDTLLDAVTVGHTFFYREQTHLEYLVEDLKRRHILNPVIWCAASATGEEPYSIAIHLLDNGFRNFLVIASDINRASLHVMHRGVYGKARFDFAPPAILPNHFLKLPGEQYRIRPEVRRHLHIKRINLNEDFQFTREVDYIFCRNVMIYFDEKMRRKVIETCVRNLFPGGLLFVGHTEALLEVPSSLRKDGSAVFRKV